MLRRHLKWGTAFTEVVMLVIALSALGSYVGWNLYSRYARIQETQRERVQNAARIIAVNLETELLAVDNTIKSVLADMPNFDFHKSGKKELIHELKNFNDAVPSIRSFFVLDADGTVIASDPENIAGNNFRDRDYFKIPKLKPNPSLIYVSPPYKTTLGDINIAFSRVLMDTHGNFSGVVVAALDPSYFATLMGSVRYAPDVWTSLVHGQGQLFMMVPARNDLVGQNLNLPGSMFFRHRESGQARTVFSGTILSTGEDRTIAQLTFRPATLPLNEPLVIAVATDLKAHFSGLRSDILAQTGLFGLLAIGSIMGLRLHQRANRRSVQRIEAEKIRWQTILKMASDGIHILNKEGFLVEANQSFLNMLGYDDTIIGKLHVSDWNVLSTWGEIKARNDDLIARQGQMVFETRHRRHDGTVMDVEINTAGINLDGEGYVYAASRDISERKKKDERLQRAAHYDSLTNLPNRMLFADRLQQAIFQTKRTPLLLVVGYLDLDGFKPVNDRYGHTAGDVVLVEIAARLRSCMRGGDTVARLGGDEFVFLLLGLDRFEECRIALERILSAINQPIAINDVAVTVSASIGVTIFPTDGGDADTLLQHADQAMYQAKLGGKNQFLVFDAGDRRSPPASDSKTENAPHSGS
ncbi:MAG TPA: diguanylate cyclase [Rhodospirillaceae bacterium]|nr:diguanylate cyclase [Rhodospirillaceae bacterium]